MSQQEHFRSQAPPPLQPRPILIPTPRETTLANGLTLVVVEDRRLPLVSYRLAFRVGGAFDPPELPGLLKGADEIWHLGDVCAPETLVEFEMHGVPMRVVRGNNDGFEAGWPLSLDLTRGGVTFHLVHIPPRRAPAGVRVLLHGHTHVPGDEIDATGTRWLNPGCISLPRR